MQKLLHTKWFYKIEVFERLKKAFSFLIEQWALLEYMIGRLVSSTIA